MGITSQFHNGVHLKILPLLILAFLRHITYRQRKALCVDEYRKINELSNFKCNLASHINKIRATAIKLDSRDSFQDLKFWPKQQWQSLFKNGQN